LNRFYWKVEAGAEFAITQPVFDPEQLLAFIEELKTRGIWIPIVAGIWPLVSARNAEFLANEVPGVVVPPEVVERMRRASEKGKDAALEEGILIAREMFERVRPHVQGIQVSAPFGRIPLALRVFEGIPGIDAAMAQGGEEAEPGDDAGFVPPGAGGLRGGAVVAGSAARGQRGPASLREPVANGATPLPPPRPTPGIPVASLHFGRSTPRGRGEACRRATSSDSATARSIG